MRSLLKIVVVGAALRAQSILVRSAVISSPTPSLSSDPPEVTPAPTVQEYDLLIRRQDPDAVSLAEILLTAVPVYLRQVAATNLPAASSLIRDEFSQGQRPYWFKRLPEDIQSYLIKKFGPPTATPYPPLSDPSPSGSHGASATTTGTSTGWSSGFSSSPPSGSSNVSSQTSSGAVTPTSSIVTRTASRSSVQSISTPTSSETSSSRISSPPPSTTPDSPPDSPPVSRAGLSRSQKIGLGVGIPVSIVGAAILFMGCCFLLRRRREKKMDGSIPPSSPGFIPHFAFQDRSMETVEHRTPLTRHLNTSTHDVGHSSWEDEGVDPVEGHNPYTIGTLGPPSNPYKLHYNDDSNNNNNSNSNSHVNHHYEEMQAGNSATSYSNPGVSINNPAPIHYPPDSATSPQDLGPMLAVHTHSSNRARGMRTSYTSLRSVAEVSEPDDNVNESPILGRNASPKQAAGRSLIPHSPKIKRKPVGSPPPSISTSSIGTSPAAAEASQKLLRQTMPEHSGSSSSGLALSTSTANTSMSSNVGVSAKAHPNSIADPVSPISPLSTRAPSNPFTYDYIEDYGPEYYRSGYYTNVDVDAEDGLYGGNGGNTSLSQYPQPKELRRKSSSSRTEWPLRNLMGSGHRRKSSPLWDRIYEE